MILAKEKLVVERSPGFLITRILLYLFWFQSYSFLEGIEVFVTSCITSCFFLFFFFLTSDFCHHCCQ